MAKETCFGGTHKTSFELSYCRHCPTVIFRTFSVPKKNVILAAVYSLLIFSPMPRIRRGYIRILDRTSQLYHALCVIIQVYYSGTMYTISISLHSVSFASIVYLTYLPTVPNITSITTHALWYTTYMVYIYVCQNNVVLKCQILNQTGRCRHAS